MANEGGVTVFVQDKECEDMRQLRARLDDLRNKFKVRVLKNFCISSDVMKFCQLQRRVCEHVYVHMNVLLSNVPCVW